MIMYYKIAYIITKKKLPFSLGHLFSRSFFWGGVFRNDFKCQKLHVGGSSRRSQKTSGDTRVGVFPSPPGLGRCAITFILKGILRGFLVPLPIKNRPQIFRRPVTSPLAPPKSCFRDFSIDLGQTMILILVGGFNPSEKYQSSWKSSNK